MQARPTVFILDDSPLIRDSLQWLAESAGLSAEAYSSAGDYLADYQPDRPGCLLLDVYLGSANGLEVLDELARAGPHLPVIVMTAHGDVRIAVRAMKAGAIDFVEKPFDCPQLLQRICQVAARDAGRRRPRANAASPLELLTPREREVLDLLVEGNSSKMIGSRLGISPKTVEAHRARIMDKFQAENVADLVRKTMLSECR